MHARADGPWYVARTARGIPGAEMRVGDAERNQVSEDLAQHYSDGRLDATELKERLDKAVGAKTHADLSGLLTDLPPLRRPDPSPRRSGIRTWATVAVALVLAAGLWHAAAWHGGPWLWIPPLPWILVALVVAAVWSRSRRRRRLPPAS